MKVLLILVGAVLLLVIVVLLIGWRLPEAHEASRSVVLDAPPQKVYEALTDFAAAPSWRKGLARVEMLGSPEGRLRFREHGEHGAVTYEVVRQEPARLLVTEIIDRDLGYSGSWTYALVPDGTGTRLTITERGVVSNVLFRFMSRFVFGHTKTIETYLASLSEHL